MAKNKNGQTVKNKKYYKNKNNPNKGKKRNKPKNKKIENNVSIIVDDKKENLNYNIIDESVEKEVEKVEEQVKEDVYEDKIVVENAVENKDKLEDKIVVPVNSSDEEFDYRTKKVKNDRKIKTDFNDLDALFDKEEQKEKFVFSDSVDNDSKKKKKKAKKNKKEEKIDESDEPIVINLNDYHSANEYTLIDDSVELPLKVSKEVYDEKVGNVQKDLVDKAFEDSDDSIGDIDRPAIFKNIVVDDGSFKRFIVKLFVLLMILILSIFFVINFSIKYMNSTTTKDVGYFESSDIEYSLCNNGKCNSSNTIEKNINTVNIKFDYDLSFDEKINFDGKYNIVAKFNINDDKTGDSLYTESKDIKKDNFKEKNVQNFEINDDAIVLLEDYKKYLAKYNKDRDANYTGEVRVNLYVDGVNGKKRVASLLIPLQDGQQVEKTIISYQAGDASIEDDGTHYGKVYVYLIIISLILVVAASIGVVLLLSGAEEEDE